MHCLAKDRGGHGQSSQTDEGRLRDVDVQQDQGQEDGKQSCPEWIQSSAELLDPSDIGRHEIDNLTVRPTIR